MEIEVGKPLEQNDIYTGICDVQVLSVNPDAKEIETFDIDEFYHLMMNELNV